MQSRSRFDHRAPAYSRFVRPVQPAGQAFDDFTSFYGNTTGSTGGTTTGTTSDANLPGKTPTDAGADNNTALYGAVSSFLGQTATTIQAIVNGGNQVEIARLNNQAREQIATLQMQAAQAQREGNQALATQQANAAAQLQQFQALLAARQQPANTALYVVGGLAVLGIVAGIVYFATRPKHNPSMNRYEAILYPVGRGRTRHGHSLGRFKTLASAESRASRVLRRHEATETRHGRRAEVAWVDIYDRNQNKVVKTVEARARLVPSVGELGYW